MKSKMLQRGGYGRLLTCQSSSECISVLREEGYFEDDLGGADALDPSWWQNLIDLKISTLAQKLTRLSPRDCQALLAEYLRRYRLEALKSGLRIMTAHEEGAASLTQSGSGLAADLLRSTAESRNLQLLLQLVGATGLLGEISSALAENTPFPLVEALIDRYGLTRMWSAADMPDSVDKQSVRPLIGEQIDVTNLLLIVRSKALGIAEEEIRRTSVPVNYRLGDALTEALSSDSTTNALRAFSKTIYGDIISLLLEKYKEGDPLHLLEVALRKRHAENCLSTFCGFPFCAGLPLAFTYLINYEASDVRSIVSGKQDGLAAEKIEQFLVL
jgi:vacuolar-type H+-ATPase subunit C/Vma6